MSQDSPPFNPFTPLCRPRVCFIHSISLPKHRFGWRPFNLNPREDSNCEAIVIIVLLSHISFFRIWLFPGYNRYSLKYLTSFGGKMLFISVVGINQWSGVKTKQNSWKNKIDTGIQEVTKGSNFLVTSP